MKIYKSTVAGVLVSLSMVLTTSCNDFLDKAPDDQLTMEMVFSDKVRTEDWLASVYSSIPSPMWGYFKEQGYNIMGMTSLFLRNGVRLAGQMCMPIRQGTGVQYQHGIHIIG